MTKNEVKTFAEEVGLDLQEIQPYHFRLSERGQFVVDVYFKRDKRGNIIQNRVMLWEKDKWADAKTIEDLVELIYN